MNTSSSSAILVFLACCILCSCGEAEADLPEIPVNPFMKGDGPTLVVAHRGGKDLFPENTLLAFDGSVQLGVDVLELDLCLTSDDVLVTMHDLTIDRTCEASGAVLEYTYDELLEFNFGYHFRAADGSFPYRDNPVRVPRLEEIFTRFPDTKMIIEIKNPGATGKRAAGILHDLVVEYGMREHVSVFSFQDDVLQHFRRINTADLYVGGSVSDAIAFMLVALDNNEVHFRRDVDVFSLPTELEGIDLISKSERIVEAAKNIGIAIHYWTINDRAEMDELIELGADGIITDKPDVLQEAILDAGG